MTYLETFLRSHSELIPSQPIPSPTGFISGETVSSCSSFPSLESAAEASGRPGKGLLPSDGFVHSENPAEMCSDEEADRKRFRDLVTQLGQHAVSAAESALPLNSSHLVALTLLSFCPKRPSVSVCHLPLNEVLYRLQIFAQALQSVQRTLSVPSNPRIAVEVALGLRY
ncbi:unnamed protein product [Cyprideis torosa]|uniref:Uncharacterized protein n=1 Tax=Cyprideis torosa TaxID=163714 RepID=A0A7R8WQQ9_9CRUS|nr:unnamed protein product [Cyprideis torosa]CAG0906888.1 unnamed protein product [Cyprideis torosa]